MNHIAQYRNGIHHQIHHNPCPPIHNFAGRFPAPNLGPLPDNVMIPQIVTEGGMQYHNAPLQPFMPNSDNGQQNDENDKVSNMRKQNMPGRSFQPGQGPIIACSSRQESVSKATETGGCNDVNNYKATQSSSVQVDNRQFGQHCDHGAKNCVQCYNLVKSDSTIPIIKVMVDAATMTEQDEIDHTGNWSVSNSSPPPNTKVTEYLSSLRQFLKVDQKITTPRRENRKQRQGDVRIVTSADGSRLYFCPECHAAYPDKNLLEPHLAAHKIERRFICNVCGAGLKRKEHLDRHQLSHSEERPYTCSVCNKTFKRNEHLSRHSVIHSGLKAQVCNECGKSFYRTDHLRKHLLGHRFPRLKRGRRRHRQDAAGAQLDPSGSVIAPGQHPFMEKERPWICGICGSAFVHKQHLERHQLTHTDERPYACPICPKAFKHNEHLSRHMTIHSPNKSQLSEERPYQCNVCDKAFKRNEHLSRHLVIHSGVRTQKERPWICGICGAAHIRKEHLERHQLTHTDERPYACPICPKAFKHNEHLSRHMTIHSPNKSQDRPWVCGVCGTGHARKEHLDRHQVTHSDLRPFPCPGCPKTFKRNEHLSRHLVIHSGQKSELCRECGKTFYRKDHLRKHAESHHNKRVKAATSGFDKMCAPPRGPPGPPGPGPGPGPVPAPPPAPAWTHCSRGVGIDLPPLDPDIAKLQGQIHDC